MARKPREPLSRERIERAALALVDAGGIDALSMRAVASALGVQAMSLYRHVADRDDLIAGLADRVLAEIELPEPGAPWREAMRRRATSARAAFLRHPSGALLIESCGTMTPTRLAYADAILGALLADGFAPTEAYRAFLWLDSYVYGFTMQELSWRRPGAIGQDPSGVEVPPAYQSFSRVMAEALARVATGGLEAAMDEEFALGLELLLEALEARRRDVPGR